MKWYFGMGLLVSCLQTISSHYLLSIPVIMVAAQKNESEGQLVLLVFLLGLAADLVSGRVVGTGVIFLAVVAMLVILLRTRFNKDMRIYLAILIVSELMYRALG